MLNLFQRLANRRAILLLTMLYLLFPAVILPYAEARIKVYSGGVGPIDLRFFYTPAEAFAMIGAYGEAGRAFYRLMELTADIAYPIAYTLFFGAVLTAALQRAFSASSRIQQVPLLVWVVLFTDLAENVGIITMLTQFPTQNDSIALLTSLFTTSKWALFGAILFTLGFSLITIVISAIRPKPRNPKVA